MKIGDDGGLHIYRDLITAWVNEHGSCRNGHINEMFCNQPKRIKHTVDCNCVRCGQSYTTKMTKTELQWYLSYLSSGSTDYIGHSHLLLCQKCHHTLEYIGKYLFSGWRKKDTFETMVNAIEDETIDLGMVAEYIRDMDYKSFLWSAYWRYVVIKIRNRDGNKCCFCGNTEQLHVHHKTYKNHGYENTEEGLADLMTVCTTCHSKLHNKTVTKGV